MAETQVLGWGTQTAPASRTTHGTEQFLLLQVEADFDGTAAAGSWIPAVQIISDAGQSVGVYPADTTLAIGATATVTFAPFLGRGGGIKFGKVNTGNWLDVETTATGPSGKGIDLDSSNGIEIDNAAGELNITDLGAGLNIFSANANLSLSTAAGTLQLTTSGGPVNISASGNAAVQLNATDVFLLNEVFVQLGTGKVCEVQDHTGAPIFRVNENGDLQGKTGKALTFNL